MTALLKTGKLIMYMFFLAFLFNEYILIEEVDCSVVVTGDSRLPSINLHNSRAHGLLKNNYLTDYLIILGVMKRKCRVMKMNNRGV